MVKSNTGPARARKEQKYDFVSYIEDLKNRTDIVHVAEQLGMTVNKHGQAECFKGHDQKTPSLKLYENSQSYHCFGCGTHGDVIGLVQQLRGCSFIDAVNELAGSVGMDRFQNTNGFDPEMYAKIKDCLNRAAEIYHSHLDPADPYLANRGISYETAQRRLIGRTQGRDDLWRALQGQGFTPDVVFLSGLVKSDFTDFFQDHIVVPILNKGTVVDFYGRSLNENSPPRHWRLPNDRVKIGHGLFNWNPHVEEIILVEGVFDALALIEHGFDHAVSTFGTNGLKEHHLRMIEKSSAKKIFIAYDGDASGREAALETGYSLEALGKEVRLIKLPDGTDPGNFMQIHSPGDFHELFNDAVTPWEWELGAMADLQDETERRKVLDDFLLRCKNFSPMEKQTIIGKISETLGMPKKLVKEQMDYLEKSCRKSEVKESPMEEVVDSLPMTPALDMVDGRLLMTVPRLMRNSQDGTPQWVPWVVTSEREWFPLEPRELLQRGYYTANPTCSFEGLETRYSSQIIRDFVAGTRTGDLLKTYDRTKALLKRYMDFPDETTYDFLAAWIMGTYCYVIFNYYPYIHFNGTKLVGKSKALRLLAALSFNGIWCVSISEAAQFRLIEAFQLTLCLDETEDLNQKQLGEKRALLLGGYEKGSRVYRTERRGDSFIPRPYNNYSPRAMASIEGLEDVLGSRTVQIQMERSYNAEIKRTEVCLNDPLFEALRDELFLAAMTYGKKIQEIYCSMDAHPGVAFGDREYNIFKPILAVGLAMERPEIIQAITDFANASYRRKVDDHNETAEENILLRFLVEKIAADGEYRSDDLHRGFIDSIKTQGLELSQPMSKGRMAKLMAKLKVCEKGARTPDRKATLYRFKRETLIRVADNYQVG